METREIIKIDEEKCNGCGECIPNCPEGALQIIDGKVRLVSDLFCDGLGACVGHCPQDAIKIEKRKAQPYDERQVMENIIPKGENVIRAHLEHLEDHNANNYLQDAIEFLREKGIKIKRRGREDAADSCPGCPSAKTMQLKPKTSVLDLDESKASRQRSELGNWPVQISLINPNAPYFENSNIIVCADCVPFAYANFHSDLLKDKSIVIGCPKLDDIESYKEKLTEIFKSNKIKSVTVAIMEVPCCTAMQSAVAEAIESSGKKIPLEVKVISISGEIV